MKPNQSHVEIYDLESQTVRLAPALELAPGMVEIFIAHLGRACWVSAAQADGKGCSAETYSQPPTSDGNAAPAAILEFRDPAGNSPWPLVSLENAEMRETLRAASVVWGVDSFTGNCALFFGDAFLSEIVRSGLAQSLSVISFLYDSRTDSLEYLYAAVKRLKGSCCYK